MHHLFINLYATGCPLGCLVHDAVGQVPGSLGPAEERNASFFAWGFVGTTAQQLILKMLSRIQKTLAKPEANSIYFAITKKQVIRYQNLAREPPLETPFNPRLNRHGCQHAPESSRGEKSPGL